MTPGVSAESHWPDSIFRAPTEAGLRLAGSSEVINLPVHRWHGPMLPEEASLLDSVTSPVLDVGCGPGRHAAALARAGYTALGIDTSAAAVMVARRRGATALNISVFGPVPNEGMWATVLLLDGNIGIGGNPGRLLARVHELMRPGGRALVEVDPPGTESRRFHARVEHAGGLGSGFVWASVGVNGVSEIAAAASLSTVEIRAGGERWFAVLVKPSI